ncbi:GTP binding protein 2 [Moniliophthora roreri MCA 2997]|uniref:GTP binding protein 2 n=1 Tax=Moniliophthora roreri (strain MCA 2997) TaxID=1381753 RepID=V2YIX9_MONRO|nr:GTP binding protein 2 [Moniliophthora roreri MCA 2997]
MFGEDESESPRVPSPWDSLMSTPASSSPHLPSPLSSNTHSPSHTTSIPTIPKLVPESDDGNVEYKLQLLNPSPTRFARLVTQLKWRLLEGGGQAYYELGVADSGSLVGLSRADLERSLETLEMMAGEIGASVIVVKEIEVPAQMAKIAAAQEDYRYGRRRRESGSGAGSGEGTTTETELSATDVDGEDDAFYTFDRYKDPASDSAIFPMDPDPDSPDSDSDPQPQFLVDLEISAVFKPRPVRRHVQAHLHLPKRERERDKTKKLKHQNNSAESGGDKKSNNRRTARDRRREEKRKALLAVAEQALVPDPPPPPATQTDDLVSGLETLHVSVEDEAVPMISLTAEDGEELGEDDVFASPTPSVPYKTFVQSGSKEPQTPLSEGTEGLLSAPTQTNGNGTSEGESEGTRLIVEALVVRKMSLEEAFLDFGGFSGGFSLT